MLYLKANSDAFENALFSKATATIIQAATIAVRAAAIMTAVMPSIVFNAVVVMHIPANKTPNTTAEIITLLLLNLKIKGIFSNSSLKMKSKT